MKVSQKQIKQIIKEEYRRLIREGWDGLSPEEQEEVLAMGRDEEVYDEEFDPEFESELEQDAYYDDLADEYEDQEWGRLEREESMYRKDPSMQFENRLRRRMRQRIAEGWEDEDEDVAHFYTDESYADDHSRTLRYNRERDYEGSLEQEQDWSRDLTEDEMDAAYDAGYYGGDLKAKENAWIKNNRQAMEEYQRGKDDHDDHESGWQY